MLGLLRLRLAMTVGMLKSGFDDTGKDLSRPQPQQAAGFDDLDKSGR